MTWIPNFLIAKAIFSSYMGNYIHLNSMYSELNLYLHCLWYYFALCRILYILYSAYSLLSTSATFSRFSLRKTPVMARIAATSTFLQSSSYHHFLMSLTWLFMHLIQCLDKFYTFNLIFIFGVVGILHVFLLSKICNMQWCG